MAEPSTDLTGAADDAGRVPGRISLAVAGLMGGIAAVNLAFFYSRGLSNLYGDGIAHVEGARRLLDSLTPGYSEIGSVWLPLFHILAAPLALNDFLWRSGLAGSLIASASFALTGWVLFLLAFRLQRNGAAAVLALAGFVLCPNFLYLASTPLTEPLALLWAVLAVYGLFRFYETGRWWPLIGGGIAAFLGTLTRYDEWYVLPFAALYVLGARREPWRQRFRHALAFSLIAGAGPVLWFLHNAYRFGNPLEFYNGPFSARAIYAHQLATSAFPYPTDGKLLLAVRYYVEDLKLVVGVWPLALALLGLVGALAARREWRRSSVALLFLVPLPFYINAMAYAAIPLYVPTLFPYTYYNLRYGLEMLPAAAFLPSFLLGSRESPKVRAALLGFFLLILTGQAIYTASAGARELVVAKEGFLNTPCRSRRQQAIIAFLRGHYDGRRVLMAVGKWPCVMPAVGIDYRNTITDANRTYWRTLRSEPDRLVEWIVRGQDDAVDELMNAYPQAFRDFELVEEDSFPGEGKVEIYRLHEG